MLKRFGFDGHPSWTVAAFIFLALILVLATMPIWVK